MNSRVEPTNVSKERGDETTLLIVHADPSATHLLSQALKHCGYTLQIAESLNGKLPEFRENPADLILIGIPLLNTNSYELCQSFKKGRLTRDIPVIMVGDRTPPQIAKAFNAGASDYLGLPLESEEIVARVQYQLNGYRQRQQLSHQNALLLQEVRERKQVENALRQTEAKYRRIFENATEGIFQTAEDGRYISVNPAFAQIYGYDSPEDLMQSITNVGKQLYVQPKRWDELAVYLRQFEKIVDAESEVYCKDGSKIWISETIRKVTDVDGQFLYYEGIVHDITERRRIEMELRQQRKQADRLLVNILPYQIAMRLKSGARSIAESFDEVTVLFADLVNFTVASGQMSPKQLVNLLNDIFSTFDRLAERHGLEKIKTIGDAYMLAGGLPISRPDHADAAAMMALDMRQALEDFVRPDGTPFQLRVGLNTGPVIAGVIGVRKFAYDLWGDTVNIASRMETTGLPDRIQVTPEVYERLKNRFLFEPRGTIAVKGRGEMESYWLIGRRHTM
ncbi:MAG: adenylate/guanylate cyclase domain-containing protein [Cyanobacteria bacterium J06626_18]